MNNSNEIIVSICCITYNHAPYIRQCLDGFLMQKTNFRYEIIIHDDCSTDGTTEIVKEYADKYPELIVPLFEEVNQYQNGEKRILATFIYPKVRGKYMAICEGDDYWIDPLKLQKQVDFLENHPDYGLVYTKAQILHDGRRNELIGEKANSFFDLLKKNSVPTLTTVFRKDVFVRYKDIIFPHSHEWKMGDYPIWLFISYYHRIHFMEDVTSVYRVLNNSASHFGNDYEKELSFLKSDFDIRFFLCERFGEVECYNRLKVLKARVILRCKLKHERKDIANDIQLIRKMQPITVKDYLMRIFAYMYPILLPYKILKKIV